MKFSIKPIVPKRNQFKAGLYKTLMDAATHEVTSGMLKDSQSTVRTWNNPPRFGVTRRGTDWYITTKNEIYGYVDAGTKPHRITARGPRFPLLFFRTGFRSKTHPGTIGSEAGRAANRDFTAALEVHHPGTKARHFTRDIKEKWSRIWFTKMQQAIRTASRG